MGLYPKHDQNDYLELHSEAQDTQTMMETENMALALRLDEGGTEQRFDNFYFY